jgi:hypothetical protein
LLQIMGQLRAEDGVGCGTELHKAAVRQHPGRTEEQNENPSDCEPLSQELNHTYPKTKAGGGAHNRLSNEIKLEILVAVHE